VSWGHNVGAGRKPGGTEHVGASGGTSTPGWLGHKKIEQGECPLTALGFAGRQQEEVQLCQGRSFSRGEGRSNGKKERATPTDNQFNITGRQKKKKKRTPRKGQKLSQTKSFENQ